MTNLKIAPRGKSLKVLCLGAHSDDIEIGCGGTILELVRSFKNVEFNWIVLSASGARKKEAAAGAAAFLAGAARRQVILKGFRDGFFPHAGKAIKEFFEELKPEVDPDLIFTPYRQDLHQDHRLVSELTWNTFRDHLILEYEIPKYDGDFGVPNVYVPLPDETRDAKIRLIRKCFPSQAGNRWFSEGTFLAVLRLRGIESNAAYAEAFYGRKLVLG